MSMVEVRCRASEALQKPSMHETAGHESSYGYLIQLVAAQSRGSKGQWQFCQEATSQRSSETAVSSRDHLADDFRHQGI
jgi:hypothetical protein